MQTVLVAVLGTAGIILSPAILAYITGRQRRHEKLEDYARQDLVAERVTEAADKTREVAHQAAEAARLLVASNLVAAETAAAATALTNGKLDQIHTLVNSNMTAAMQAELDATRALLAMMREFRDFKATAGKPASRQALAAIEETERKVGELATTLDDRLAQTRVPQTEGN